MTMNKRNEGIMRQQDLNPMNDRNDRRLLMVRLISFQEGETHAALDPE
jgi:hypothetical protein